MSEFDGPRDEYGFRKPEREWTAAERAEVEKRRSNRPEGKWKVEMFKEFAEQLEAIGKIVERFCERHLYGSRPWRERLEIEGFDYSTPRLYFIFAIKEAQPFSAQTYDLFYYPREHRINISWSGTYLEPDRARDLRELCEVLSKNTGILASFRDPMT